MNVLHNARLDVEMAVISVWLVLCLLEEKLQHVVVSYLHS